MRKFAFFFAVVAVLAMSACAFAAASVTNPTDVDTPGNPGNIDSIQTGSEANTANFYFFRTYPEPAINVGAKFTATKGNTDFNETKAAGSVINENRVSVADVVVTPDNNLESGTEAERNFQINFHEGYSLSNMDGRKLRMGITLTGDAWEAGSQGGILDLTARQLKIFAMRDGEDISVERHVVKTSDPKFTVTIEGTADEDTLETKNLVAKQGYNTYENYTAVPSNGDVIATWNATTGELTIDPSKAKYGDSLYVSIQAPETNSAKILKTNTDTAVAGVEASTTLKGVTFGFVDYIAEPDYVRYDLAVSSDVAISFDVDMDAEQLDAISCDGVILLSTDPAAGAKVGATSDYLSNDIAVSADKPEDKHIVVTLGKDFLNAKIDEAKEKFVSENLNFVRLTLKVVDKSAKSVDISVGFLKASDPSPNPDPDPNTKEDPISKPTSAERNAVNKIVASSDVYGLGEEAKTEILKWMVPHYSSNDISEDFHISDAISGVEIVVTVEYGKDEFVVIPQAQINESLAAATANGNGQNIQLIKRFIDPDDDGSKTKFSEYIFPSDFVKVTKGTDGLADRVELNAMVIVVDGKAPASAQERASEWHQGASDGQGLILTTIDEQNVVIVYDGISNGAAVDPIYAKEVPGGSSSSGACNMGFGLVAVAGLAAIALKRRDR